MTLREMLVCNPLIDSNMQCVSLEAESGFSFTSLPIRKIFVTLFSTDLLCFLRNAMTSQEMLVCNPLIQSNIQGISFDAESVFPFGTLPIMKIV